MFVIWRGIDTIRVLEGIAAPLMLGVGVLLLWWITSKAGGLGPVFSAPAKFRDNAEFFRFFIPSLTGMVRILVHDHAEHSRFHAITP